MLREDINHRGKNDGDLQTVWKREAPQKKPLSILFFKTISYRRQLTDREIRV